MPIILDMIACNIPLSSWKQYVKEAESGQRARSVWHGGKNPSREAKIIHTALSHSAVVELVHKEFDDLPPAVRVALMNFCNSEMGSNNVHKGVQALNKLLNGRLLAEQGLHPTHRVMGKDGWESRRVNQAKAGAMRKYATYGERG